MIKRGTGIGCMWYGVGNTGLPNPAAAFVEMHMDGTVTVLTGCADIGQGSDTAMAQIVAATFGIDSEAVIVRSADTGITPEAGASSASRQTYISGNACKKAAEMAKSTLVEIAANMLGVEEAFILLANNKVFNKNQLDQYIPISAVLAECAKRGVLIVGSGHFNPDTTSLDLETMEGRPYGAYAFATQVAEVEVDTETGEIRLLQVVAAHDVGKAINRQLVDAQIEGGVLMGAGFALTEEIVVKDGRITNPNFSSYIMLTAKDTPKIHPIIVEDHEPTGPFGAKGVGEPALIPTPPAIVNAVYDAIGIRFYELPISQEKVIEHLKKQREA